MSRYCLDTVAYSHFKRGENRITELLDSAQWIGVPVVVIGELCAGFAKGPRQREHLDELNEFLALPVVETLPVDKYVAELFGEIVEELRRKGHPVPINDVWIGATCACAGATLLTWDAHFRSISRIGSVVFEG